SRRTSTGGWSDLEVESSSERDQGREGGVRLLGREEASDRLWLHSGASSQLGLGEVQLLASGIEGADHRVDLLDPLACLLVGLAVLGILQATSEVALCSRLCRHVVQGSRNVHVTHITAASPGRLA